ncbi:putative inactive purple acid phosphatase 28 isoform X1 [Senna tora]|uniref:Putative inactive purple acid phosphatase 28 isoform X1 n=1 Tax=Senna tora TaxID=362788 RepID=A0A834SMU3_9FABA|nr:putative inactive purple acid phosphatase 28 isoform X1 [Senna tora]
MEVSPSERGPQRENPNRCVMMDSGSYGSLNYSFLYLTFLLALPYFIHYHFLPKLFIGGETVRVKKTSDLPLRFRSDGTFKILQVADMHYGSGIITSCRDVMESEFKYCSDLNTTRFLKRMIQAESPDFIAFTGDNIFGSSTNDAAESMFKAFGPAMESGLPWAAVLGNHDQESTMNREELMSFISLMDYSVSQVNPSTDDSTNPTQGGMITNIDGFGNYHLRVFGAPGSTLANSSIMNLFFLDSGDRTVYQGIRTYGWIKDSQLNWLRNVSQECQGQKQNPLHSDGFPPLAPPALVFFHIPIKEVRQLFNKGIVGQFQEGVACSIANSGVLETFLSMRDVKAVFMGHDHKNDFCGNLDGVWFCYGGGFGYHAYGSAGWPRRARIILAELQKGETSWMGVEKIKTWKRLDDEKLSKIDEQILWGLSS